MSHPPRASRALSTDPIAERPLEPRVVGRLGHSEGPTLICVAGLHGNEPMGVVGLQRAFRRLLEEAPELRGRVLGLVGNRKALTRDLRFIDHDLNRVWFADRLERLRRAPAPITAEDEELLELDAEIEPLLEANGHPVHLLDLHTTSGPGPPFAVVEDTLGNRELALHFPVPLVLGFEEEVEGTLSNYLCARGVRAVGFEAGQHRDPAAADRAEAAVWIALEATGLLPAGGSQVEACRTRLRAHTDELPTVVEVRYRHAIGATDNFRMAPGFKTFEAVESGRTLALDRRGPVTAPESGLLLMPLYQEQGDDGFFIVREVWPVWLRVSAAMRRMRLERYVHLLPGVRRHPERAGTFIVDRRVARWLTLQIFHLLGFRRVGPPGRFLVLARRAHD